MDVSIGMRRLEPRPNGLAGTRAVRVLAITLKPATRAEVETWARSSSVLSVSTASSITAGVTRLEQCDFDAVIVELPLTSSAAKRALTSLRETAPEAAFVALVETPDAALAAIEHGADDYLVIGAFDELLCLRVIRHAMERKAWQRELRTCWQQGVQLHERLGIGLFELDLEGRLKAVNETFCLMLGREPGAAGFDIGPEFFRSQRQFKAWFKALEGARGTFKREFVFGSREGSELVGMTCVHACHDSLGRRLGYRGAVMDITATAERAASLPYEACHDLETGLYNARMFERSLRLGLEQACEDDPIVVCRIRVDLSAVENQYGKRAGRELMRSVSAIVWDNMRRNEVLARLDSDSMGVILRARTPIAGVERAWVIVERIKSARLDWAGSVHYASAVAGVVFVDDSECDPSAILAATDNACDRALAESRPVTLAKPGPRFSRRNVEAMQWASRLKSALAEGTLSLYCQRIVPIGRTEGSRVRFDVLARYAGVDGKLYAPSAFMPAVREYNLSATFDLSVLGTLLSSDVFRCSGGRTRWFVVRLSDETLAEPGFPERLRACIEKHALPHRTLCLAIRQEAVYENALASRRLAATVRALRCELMLEQFGEPLSVSALKELRPAYLRVSPSLVRGIATDRMHRRFLQSLAHLAGVTGARVIAPFVEDAGVLPILQDCGVDYAQGFAMGRPEPMSKHESRQRLGRSRLPDGRA